MEKVPKISLPLKHLSETFRQPVLAINLNGTITESNKSADSLLKHLAKELTGKSIFDIFLPQITREWLNTIAKEIKANEIAERELEVLLDNNATKRIKISCYPEYSRLKRLSGIILVIHEKISSTFTEEGSILNEEKFRFLFENMKEGCAIHKLIENEDGKPIDYEIIEVNNSYEHIVGIKANEACGKLASVLYQSNEPPFLREYAEVSKTGKSIEFVAYFKPLDKHFNISASQVRPGFFATIFSDITPQVKDKERLAESEDKFRSLYENAPLPYQSLNSDGSFKDVNPAWLSTLGYKREEVIGKYYVDFLHPDWQDHFHTNFPAFKKRGYVSDVQFKIRHKKGHYLNISFEGCIGYNPDGSVKQTYCVFKDITQQVKAEHKLLESEHKFRLLAENTKDWEYWIDENDKFRFISNGCKQISGYSANEFLENPDLKHQIVHPTDKDAVIKDHKTVSLSEVPNHHSKFRIIHKSGQEVWIEHFCIPVYDEDGKFIGRRGNNRDISAQVKHEKELVKAKKKAEESDKIKSAFLANMSHEVRTPMNGILGFIELLREPDLSAQQREEYLYIVEKSSTRLLNTLNDIIEVSKIEVGDLPINTAEINLPEFLADVVSFFKAEAEEKGIKIEYALCADNVKTVHSDKGKLESILANLIKNAIKFTDKGTIQIGCKSDNSKLKLWVKDTGMGIENEKLNNIFERFSQGHIELNRGYEGTGLGLAICKAYTKILGGKIWVQSEVGKGSTFFFTIENLASPNRETPTPEHENNVGITQVEMGNNNKEVVLIAEDDLVSYYFLKVVVEELGFEIIHATNGKEAVELFSEKPNIALVLMDLKMPVMDGYEATKQIKAKNENCYIIAQTAFGLEDDEQKALEAGCDDYISKPIVKDVLVKKLLNKHK